MEVGFDRTTIAGIEKFQESLLKEQITYLLAHSPYYKRLFQQQQLSSDAIQTIADLQKIPTTTKNDLQQYNADFFCVEQTEVIDYCTTSGTLGAPVTFGLTDRDLERLAFNELKSFESMGVTKGDIVQLMTTMDRRFMAGMAYFLGLRKLGAAVLRVGSGIPQLQWDSILTYKPKFLIAVPSFLLKMIEYAELHGIDYRNSSVERVLCIGESLRTPTFGNTLLTQRILEKWPIKLYSTYASTEMGAAFTECDAFQGGHVREELIITEVLDEQEQPVPDGAPGELVVTTLGVEGLPLLRFKTGDIVRKHTQVCSCGQASYRIGPVEGRKQHMIKYKGTTLYPPAMHDVLAAFPQIEMHLIEISTNAIGTDEIVIYLASTDPSPELLAEVKDHFRAKLRVAPTVLWQEAEVLQGIIFNPLHRKPITFIDKRVSFA